MIKKNEIVKFSFLIPVLIVILSGCSSASKSKAPVPPQIADHQDEEMAVFAEEERAPTNFHRPETWLMGYVQPELFSRPPHDEWYSPEYAGYTPDMNHIYKITEATINGISILVVLGTWCPDSHREVPRFLKILDQCGLSKIKITFLGVDMNKIAPIGDYDKLDIKRVPTFIVYKNNIELGRIIEYPLTSLEGDLAEILHKQQE